MKINTEKNKTFSGDLINLSCFQRIDLEEDSHLLKEILLLFEELKKLEFPFFEFINLHA